MADYMALPIIQAAKQAGFPVAGKDGLVVTEQQLLQGRHRGDQGR